MSQSSTPDDPSSVKSGGQENPRHNLQVMLAAIWERSKSKIEERVQILQQATTAAMENKLDERSKLDAVESAHKLAGVLGTFGLPRGTELAREAEEAFGRPAISGAELQRLAITLEELSQLVKTAGLPFGQHDSV
jgi:HPt (histidine-containing phosphotransfer) domain-containing protein